MKSSFLLDTNFVSETLRRVPDAKVAAWLEEQNKDSQFISVIAIGELRRVPHFLRKGPGEPN
jgi:predicted nucleic acid-binding protein